MPLEAIRNLSPSLYDEFMSAVSPRRVAMDLARLDRRVFFRFFKGYRPEKIGHRLLQRAVTAEIFEGTNERVAEALVIAWNDGRHDLYEAMHSNVARLNPNVEAIERIEDPDARVIVADLRAQGYSPSDIYLCTVLNEVRFTPEFRAALHPDSGVDVLAAMKVLPDGAAEAPPEPPPDAGVGDAP